MSLERLPRPNLVVLRQDDLLVEQVIIIRLQLVALGLLSVLIAAAVVLAVDQRPMPLVVAVRIEQEPEQPPAVVARVI